MNARSDGPRLARRRFLVLGSAGLMLGTRAFGATDGHARQEPGTPAPALAQRFLAIAPDGTVTVFAKHVDMGQGIWSGLAAIVAEELGAEWTQVRVVGAPAKLPDYAHTIYGAQTTGGSTSIANSWDELRAAGATARAMLTAAAAMHWHVSPQSVSIAAGRVQSDHHSATLGRFAAAAARLPVPDAAPLRDPSAFRIVGQRRARLDLPDKVRGKTRYGLDTGWDGIKALVILHPPRFGATLRDFDAAAALALPGVLAIERIPGGIAVIGETTWHALRGRAALVADWDESAAETRSTDTILADFHDQMASRPPTAETRKGEVTTAPPAHVAEATFTFPYLAHVPIEPLSVAGKLAGGRCTLRSGFQSQSSNQASAARILGLPIEAVELETVHAGGSFGRRADFGPDWFDELIHALKATGGRWPLRLMWSRDDDITGGRYRPMTLHRIAAQLAADGTITRLDHGIVGQPCFPLPAGEPLPKEPSDGAVTGHFAEQYACTASRLAWWYPEVKIKPHTYRAIANNHNGLVKEIFVDRLARAARIDPVAYRLSLLAHEPRQQGVLRLAAEKAGWDRPPGQGLFRGVAVHRADDSHVAQIVEVSGSPSDFRIERVVCAIDCGIVIDPDTVTAQAEGGIGFGLSSALFQEITLDDTGRVEQSNFHDYRILRMPEMPRRIEVHIVPSTERPTGVGEPPSVPVAAALVNALEAMGMEPVARFPLVRSAR
ncbi:xanthine dehydrogenase family protein molybdopterin-binding subunit [Novosphingobium resinovorum]|uniref:xanthine dehydrogenase family protein molybdopterin-binding subunit n=1 Tax=Novosphingobium resinovorum TaxID=158500 RepID=UPI002ED42BBF|nr:molybdopterin cofactor-binding domain-containing protein [Novosphingobium resinovorum]